MEDNKNLFLPARKKEGKPPLSRLSSGTLFCRMNMKPVQTPLPSLSRFPWRPPCSGQSFFGARIYLETIIKNGAVLANLSSQNTKGHFSLEKMAVPEPCGVLKPSSSPSLWEEPPSALQAACPKVYRQLPFHPTRGDRQMSHSTGLD